MKVAITTHIARIQKIDEYPALLNVGKEYVYSLGSITDHDLSYVPLNWKDKQKQVLINIERKQTQSCNPEYIIELKKSLCQYTFHFIKYML